eukprot:CAMPEP_0204152264 /NCGR_PEP_ID=MMETSP0361-20130328/26863_1 /ASSEMBLY_ACC=CAM_ASM_000343 /TAXON_ID=268821 /ORGANISM="Scrippsiella Hangoei, Strain SHTV-5" /LENGTH=82 /DNA_ID=CAMNT_0051107191 /DNA_START=21 /DNA_END=266 /DNA_ORIENTATION=+
METSTNYGDFAQKVSTSQLIVPMYIVISGVSKGTIIASDIGTVAHQMTLGETNLECRGVYIIITKFDYYFHDIREWFDPIGG